MSRSLISCCSLNKACSAVFTSSDVFSISALAQSLSAHPATPSPNPVRNLPMSLKTIRRSHQEAV